MNCCSRLLFVVMGITLFTASPLFGQTDAEEIGVDTNPVDEESAAKKPGFNVEFDDELNVKLSDFERHLKHKAWEKAIRVLSELPQDSSKIKGLLPANNGFLIPAQQKFQELLLEVPAEGREAFHLFFDGRAKKMYKSVSRSGALSEKDLATSRNIFINYFFTSVGDNATELLGDSAFEQGEFDSAAMYYSAILQNYPDSELSELNLHVKHALALIRANKSNQAQTVIRVIAQQFSDKKVLIGGKSLLAEQYLLELIAARQSQQATSEKSQEFEYGNSSVPIQKMSTNWQSIYLFPKLDKQLNSNSNRYYGEQSSHATYIPATASDSERVYINYFGVCLAINLQSGKMIWRSQKLQNLSKSYEQYRWSQRNSAQFQVAIHHKMVLANCRLASENNSYQSLQRLIAFDSATGKVLWNSKDIKELAQSSFLSKALFDNDRFYVLSHKQRQPKLELHCIRTSDGKQLWTEPMGIAVTTTNRYSGETKFPVPLLSKHGTSLRILTNNGALIDFNIPARKPNWVFKYAYLQKKQNNDMWYWNPITPLGTKLHSDGKLLEENGIIYLKEKGVTDLVAIDSAQRKLLWKRPVKRASVLVGMDQQNLYLLSDELDAIDRKTHKLKWTTTLPITAGGLSAIVTPENLHVFTNRGIYKINKTNGDTESIHRGEDMSSLGGRLVLIDNCILSLSNRAVTSYAFEKEKKKEPNKQK